jgi:hypothetical protein
MHKGIVSLSNGASFVYTKFIPVQTLFRQRKDKAFFDMAMGKFFAPCNRD